MPTVKESFAACAKTYQNYSKQWKNDLYHNFLHTECFLKIVFFLFHCMPQKVRKVPTYAPSIKCLQDIITYFTWMSFTKYSTDTFSEIGGTINCITTPWCHLLTSHCAGQTLWQLHKHGHYIFSVSTQI